MTAVIRTIILYLLIIVGIRLMGKRQIGELEPSELVLSLIIADLAAVPMQDFGTPLIMGVIPILTLLCLSAILSVLTVKSIRFRALLCSRPSIVIQDGKIIVGEMRRNRFTIDELMEELRMAGITDLSQVKYAVLETTGRISVLPYAEARPVTNQAMGLKVQEKRAAYGGGQRWPGAVEKPSGQKPVYGLAQRGAGQTGRYRCSPSVPAHGG